MTDFRIDKLPKWAKDHIDSLERENANLNRRLSELTAEDPWSDSPVGWEYSINEEKHSIKPHARVIFFRHDRGRNIQAYIDTDGKLILSADSRLVIRPIASNCAYLSAE